MLLKEGEDDRGNVPEAGWKRANFWRIEIVLMGSLDQDGVIAGVNVENFMGVWSFKTQVELLNGDIARETADREQWSGFGLRGEASILAVRIEGRELHIDGNDLGPGELHLPDSNLKFRGKRSHQLEGRQLWCSG